MRATVGTDANLDAYLAACRDSVSEEMRRILPSDHRSSGGLYKLMSEYPLREGKGLRPALCIAVARILGGYVQEVLPTAASLELFHNAFLVHDDIEDGSALRRGRATLNGMYGDPIAVNVGDAMFGLTLEPLLGNTRRIGLGRALEVLSLVSAMVRHTAEGQMMELDWIRRNAWDLGEADYIRMVYKKTAWYSFLCPVLCGCAATGNRDMRGALARYAILLGVAFQIQDDALNLLAAGDAYGKEEAGDLWEGKRTLILIHALRAAPPGTRDRMVAILAKPRPGPGADPSGSKTPEEVRWLLDAVRSAGSLDYARGEAVRRASRARSFLVRDIPRIGESVHGRFLLDLSDYVVERTR